LRSAGNGVVDMRLGLSASFTAERVLARPEEVVIRVE